MHGICSSLQEARGASRIRKGCIETSNDRPEMAPLLMGQFAPVSASERVRAASARLRKDASQNRHQGRNGQLQALATLAFY